MLTPPRQAIASALRPAGEASALALLTELPEADASGARVFDVPSIEVQAAFDAVAAQHLENASKVGVWPKSSPRHAAPLTLRHATPTPTAG